MRVANLLRLIVACLCVSTGPAFSQVDVYREHFADDYQHSIQVVPTALPHAGPYNDATLIVRAKDKVLARYPTGDAVIVDEFWSPDGKFVAAAQHTVGGGDFVWVLRLKDGKALKKPELLRPVPRQPLYSTDVLAARVRAKLPEFRHAISSNSGASIEDWTAQNELVIRAVVSFHAVKDSVEIIDTYRVTSRGLHLVRSQMHKDPPVDLQHPLGGGTWPNKALQRTGRAVGLSLVLHV